MNIETELMFAVPLGMTTLPEEVCDIFKNLKGGIQRQSAGYSRDFFDVLIDYPRVKQDITDIFSVWVNNTYACPNQKWTMLTNWITDNPDGTEMTRHRHYNCAFSAVFYFDKVQDGQGNLLLDSPLDHSDFYTNQPSAPPTIFNSVEYLAPLHEGLIIFFPANIYHQYRRYIPDKDAPMRRSFACNFAPIGTYGNQDSWIDTNLLQHGNK